MNDGGPTTGREPNRVWPLLALLGIVALAVNPPVKVQIQPVNQPEQASPPEAPSDRAGRARGRFAAAPAPTLSPSPEPWDSPPELIELPPLAGLVPPGADAGPLGLLAARPFARGFAGALEIPSAPEPVDPPPPLSLDSGVVRTAWAAATPERQAAPGPEPAPTAPEPPPALQPAPAPEPPPLLQPERPAAPDPAPPPGPDAQAPPTPSARKDVFGLPMPDPARFFSAAARRETPPISDSDSSRTPVPGEPADGALPALSTPGPSRTAPANDPHGPPGPPAVADRSPAPSGDAAPAGPSLDVEVEPAGCAACGRFHSLADGPVFHDMMGGAGGQCIPGRQPCALPFPECDSVLGAMVNNLYQCLCCPDPCYQPRWEPAANASFFADYARPRTVTRFRYDNLESLVRPDRNQFWINQVRAMHNNTGKITDLRARLQQVYIYQEAAGERGSFFIEYPYRQLNPSFEPTQAGFGDMNFGMKSLFFDCELLQLTFQFRTFAPTGNFANNLGTGHFSLDPSILAALKLGPDTYLQGQYGNWIPLGGNSKLAGGVFYWFTSLNQVLWYCTPDSPLIATLELDGWSFENGGYTSAIRPGGNFHYVQKGGGVSYFNIGPGLRQSICNRMDIGGAITWATSSIHWAQPWFRFEVRFLF